MKFKLTVILVACVVTLGLLLGTSAAQAAEVIFDPDDADRAIGITDLVVDGTPYNVTFTTFTPAAAVYGEFPGVFDFITIDSAAAAVDAVNAALIDAGADGVGADASIADGFYRIGYASEFEGDIESVTFWEGTNNTGSWVRAFQPDIDSYNLGKRVWADFTVASEADPVTIGGIVTGLVNGGLVLQNNGTDDETIDADGEFTFDTPLTPGTSYNVTVAIDPSNPAQTCTVANGSGQVPSADVTNVAVSCGELVVGDVIKVAAEGEILPDSTVLKQILLDGGVAINIDGKVAFGGKDDANTVAVFTQDGLVAKEDDILTSGTLNEIKDQGKVAINNFDVVAFHGKIQIGSGPFDQEEFTAVFTSDGLETLVATRAGLALPDDTTVEGIDETGGVAINDFFDEVAFHGDVVDPDAGSNTKKAVFTSEGLVAAEGDTLNDGTTLLDDINENGGVAINIFGDVAFHGDAIDPDAGSDSVKAVFTQDGLVVKEGDILPDGTTLDDINDTGGVAINPYGLQVAFHGKVGTTDAVFVGLAPIVE